MIIEKRKGLCNVKQYIILINVCIKLSIEFKYLKEIESDNHPNINLEKQLTKGVIAKIFCWYDVGILFLIAIFLHWLWKKVPNGEVKIWIRDKNINLLLFNAFFKNFVAKSFFFGFWSFFSFCSSSSFPSSTLLLSSLSFSFSCCSSALTF